MSAARLRPAAEEDLVERTRYYRRQAGQTLGQRFFDAAISRLRDIERFPRAGSSASELSGVPDLRVARIATFPCGWSYLPGTDGIDVVRLLAFSRDLPAILSEPAD